jgi:glutathione-independent formaldehyde dehydrogenase
VIYGAGPVELLAAYSATLKGAAKVMIVDRHPDRLRLAESIGAIPIDDSKIDPIEKVLELTGGEGVDRAANASAGKRMIRKVMSIPT